MILVQGVTMCKKKVPQPDHRSRQSRRQISPLRGTKRLSGGGPKFEIKHKSRCLQKIKLVNWRGASMSIGGPGSPLAPALRPDLKRSRSNKKRTIVLLRR